MHPIDLSVIIQNTGAPECTCTSVHSKFYTETLHYSFYRDPPSSPAPPFPISLSSGFALYLVICFPTSVDKGSLFQNSLVDLLLFSLHVGGSKGPQGIAYSCFFTRMLPATGKVSRGSAWSSRGKCQPFWLW